MYKIEKYRWEDRNRLFWITDWHIFHNPSWEVPIWESRGYLDHRDAAERTKDKINERVGKDDTLYYLGDGFLNATDDQVLSWLSDIKCQNIKYLFGNHESNMYRLFKQEVKRQYGFDDLEVYPIRMGNVVFIGNHAEILVGKKKIVMNHFAQRIFNNDSRGSWNLSGHSHGQDRGRRPEAEHQKAVDLAWDIKKDVWSFNDLDDVMSTKSVEIIDRRRE